MHGDNKSLCILKETWKKLWKMTSAFVKTDVKQYELNDLVTVL